MLLHVEFQLLIDYINSYSISRNVSIPVKFQNLILLPNLYIYKYVNADEGKSLSWVVWLKILTGAARYLDFLHSSDDHIIFCDFALSSIFLDWVHLNL